MAKGLSGEQKNKRPEAAAAAQAPANRVAELKVSAHLMTLDSGLFCVFQTPGSPPPDPVTSLPGVRITPAPGVAGRPEAVSVSTFREDGWLNGTAALVRVTEGAAQILVTIYQDKNQDAAPRLQVLRLSSEPAAAAAAAAAPAGVAQPAAAVAAVAQPQAPAVAPAKPDPEMMAHVQRAGDQACDIGAWLGTKGSRQWIEGFGIAPRAGIAHADIEYQAILGRNWLSPWVEGGKYCGSRGMALPLLGFKVRLKNEAARLFDVSYSATFIDGSTAGPAKNGETCESGSLAALESFQIVITPRAADAAGAKGGGKPAKSAKPAAKPGTAAGAVAGATSAAKAGVTSGVKSAAKPSDAGAGKPARKSAAKPASRPGRA